VSAKVNATAIGAFVIGAIALLVGSIVFFGGELFGSRLGKVDAAVIFTGSVKGLNVGAPVTLRGVKIGEVTDIHVSFDPRSLEFVIPVKITVDRKDLGVGQDVAPGTNLQALIDRGLRAQLKTQSLLTGLLYVDFEFLPQSQPRYVDFETAEPQIPTAPTELEAILERVGEMDLQAFLQNADQTLRAVATLLANPETQGIPANINATLADMRTLVANTDRQVAATGARLDALAGTADGTLLELRGKVDETGVLLDRSLQTLDRTLLSLQRASDEAGYSLSEQSPVLHELTRTAAELGRAGRALQALADALARQPEALLRGRRERSEE
jgi:paraquat-inducible protein B